MKSEGECGFEFGKQKLCRVRDMVGRGSARRRSPSPGEGRPHPLVDGDAAHEDNRSHLGILFDLRTNDFVVVPVPFSRVFPGGKNGRGAVVKCSPGIDLQTREDKSNQIKERRKRDKGQSQAKQEREWTRPKTLIWIAVPPPHANIELIGRLEHPFNHIAARTLHIDVRHAHAAVLERRVLGFPNPHRALDQRPDIRNEPALVEHLDKGIHREVTQLQREVKMRELVSDLPRDNTVRGPGFARGADVDISVLGAPPTGDRCDIVRLAMGVLRCDALAARRPTADASMDGDADLACDVGGRD
ncbi:hypothetical protein C8F04DRAFT_1108191 [Mycena alexandri]|uniref:Uncharacterized protein n=1 Tax=Mycena alexandri TaxID=1745969 RepID=A0AAD6SRR1_9AGAR|nr:hypothetical protein C8F04DRAFT_1108191 [Mycena alexandri]